jgi:hypothetical protein
MEAKITPINSSELTRIYKTLISDALGNWMCPIDGVVIAWTDKNTVRGSKDHSTPYDQGECEVDIAQ